MKKRRMWIVWSTVGLAVASVLLLRVGPRVSANEHDLSTEARIGFNIAPLPLNLKGKDRNLVGLGSYIVNAVADCNGCHSTNEYAPGGNPFMGQKKVVDTGAYLRGGQAFGPFVSRNIRPEIGSGRPAGLTYPQFLSVMRHGTDYDNPGQLLQVMPWPAFQNMTEQDLQAIYTYLWALPAVPAPG